MEDVAMNRPKVVVVQIASLDGKLTLAANTVLLYGDERWQEIAGFSSEVIDWLKFTHKPEALLEGSGSFLSEEQEPEPLPPFSGDAGALYRDYLPEEVVKRPEHRGWFAVVDGRGRVRWLYKEYPGEEWQGWHLLVLVSQDTPAAYLAYLRRESIPYLVAGEERVNLRRALEKMRSELGVTCVLSEAGGRLNGALLRAGLVDEVNVDFFPALIGSSGAASMFQSPDLAPDEWPTRLRLLSAQARADGRVWLRYEVLPGQSSQS